MKQPLEVITVPPNIVQQVIDSKISVKKAANKISRKYKTFRRNKALWLLKLRGNKQVLNDNQNLQGNRSTKRARIVAKKISDRYKKIRNKKILTWLKRFSKQQKVLEWQQKKHQQ